MNLPETFDAFDTSRIFTAADTRLTEDRGLWGGVPLVGHGPEVAASCWVASCVRFSTAFTKKTLV